MVTHIFWHTFRHHVTTRIAAFGAQVNQPITGANHIQIVLNHNQRMTTFQQLAQGAHQLGDVVKMQTGGGLIEQKQSALLGNRLFAGSGRFGSTRQEPSQLQTLRLATRQGGHGLAQLHVFQAHIHDGLQGTNHIAVLCKQGRRFTDREVQHIGHIQVTGAQITQGLSLNFDFQYFRAIPFAIAIGAT